jgi:hypothetical protein
MIRKISGITLVVVGGIMIIVLLTYGGPIFPHIIGPVLLTGIGGVLLSKIGSRRSV